ncbi:CS1-pili formation C-terminal domain-containing protein [Pantoea sp. SIMBA_133]
MLTQTTTGKVTLFLLAFCACFSAGAQGTGQDGPLSRQAEALPEAFRRHIFNTPLLARVDVDGEPVGEALLMLSQDEKVHIIEFVDGDGGDMAAQGRWAAALAAPAPLGVCSTGCPPDVSLLSYSLNDTTLRIQTGRGSTPASRWVPLPQEQTAGAVLSNRLNLNSDSQSGWYGNYTLDALGSLGSWSWQGEGIASRASQQDMQFEATQLFVRRELPGHYLQGGYFSPDTAGNTGVSMAWGGVSRLSGVMAGSSDARLTQTRHESQVPLYVTAGQPGSAEIYRDSLLLYTQVLTQGVQTLNTAMLPDGIYPVTVRVLEGGRVVNEYRETVYKSRRWRDLAARWRWRAYAGQETPALMSTRATRGLAGTASGGADLSVLLHPSLVLGLSGRWRPQASGGAGLEWTPDDRTTLSGSTTFSAGEGRSWRVMGRRQIGQGSLSITHEQSTRQSPGRKRQEYTGPLSENAGRTQSRTQVSAGLYAGQYGSLTTTLTHEGGRGPGGDVSWSVPRSIAGIDTSWRLSAFDRPYGNNMSGSRRDQGAALTVSFPLDGGPRRYDVTLSTQSDARGRHDPHLTLAATQDIHRGGVSSASASLDMSRRGAGGGGGVNFAGSALSGSAFGQYQPQSGFYSSLNLNNTMATGGGALTLSGEEFYADGGMVIDVSSDVPDARLYARDSQGGQVTLRPGKNFVPLPAWLRGNVEVGPMDDRADRDAPALRVLPANHDYQLVKGGVTSRQVKVMKTVTVVGQLTDAAGRPVSGARLVNHAGHSVSEDNGLFTLELSEATPEIALSYPDGQQCTVNVTQKARNDVVNMGTLRCPGTSQRGVKTPALSTPAPEKSGATEAAEVRRWLGRDGRETS